MEWKKHKDTQLLTRTALSVNRPAQVIPPIHHSWVNRENMAYLMPQSCSYLSAAANTVKTRRRGIPLRHRFSCRVRQTTDVNNQTICMADEQRHRRFTDFLVTREINNNDFVFLVSLKLNLNFTLLCQRRRLALWPHFFFQGIKF